MTGFASHQRWQVRMYAARAAAAMDDTALLDRLAMDDDDNVREAALPALRRLQGPASDEMYIAALQRPDYQLLRTAARELKGTRRRRRWPAPLRRARAGDRGAQGNVARSAWPHRAGELAAQPMRGSGRCRDFDPVWRRRPRRCCAMDIGSSDVDPRLLPPNRCRAAASWRRQAVVTMDSGRSFTSQRRATVLPFATRLATPAYYDGLTFHRVVPNAFIQGGSPGANEYAGDRLVYMRDEVGLGLHTRGSVGISTRGRDTGDAQIFIDLVDNPPHSTTSNRVLPGAERHRDRRSGARGAA